MINLNKSTDRVAGLMADWKRVGVRHRSILLTGGAIVFVFGLAWSVTSLDLTVAHFQWRFLPLAIGAVAAAVVVNAAEQWLAAKALKIEYSFGRGVQVSCWATLANVLPVPGALLVRSASFARAGASARDNALVLGAGAVNWVLLASAMVAFAAVPTLPVAGFSATLLLAAVAVSVRLGRRFVPAAAAALLLMRIVLIALTVVRLYAFMGWIGGGAVIREAAVYAGASLVGQVVGIVPGGIGVVEAVGAGLAPMIDGAPAEAFLGLSLNRAFGLAAAGLVVGCCGLSLGRRK